MKKLILLATVCFLTSCDALSESKVKPSPNSVSSATPIPVESETPGPTSSGTPTPSQRPSVASANSTTTPTVGSSNPTSSSLSQLTPPTVTYSTAPSQSPKASGQKLPSPSKVVPSPSVPLISSGSKENGKETKSSNGVIENSILNQKPVSPLTISDGGIGAIKVGMTLGDLKKSLKNKATFENKSDFATGYNALAVVQQGKVQFYIPYQKKKKIADTDQVRYLVTENPVYKTAEGVSPGMTIKQATAAYGNAKLALNRQMQAEELVMFASQPADLRFFSGSTGSKNRAGIYPKSKGENLETEKYTESGRIKRIAVICQESVCGSDQPDQH
jgi:hypothetical protein